MSSSLALVGEKEIIDGPGDGMYEKPASLALPATVVRLTKPDEL